MIHNADCMTLDLSGDVMIVDPPYAPRVHNKARSCTTPGKGYVRKNDLGFDPISEKLFDHIAWLAANRVYRWSVIFTDVESVGLWKDRLESNGIQYIRAIPWVRWSMPCLQGDRPPQGCEMVVLAHPPTKKHWEGPGNLTHLSHLALRGEGKHRTEKPLDLMLDLVSYFSDPKDTVIDPCAGSGTTGLACRILKRNFEGAELDKEWAKKANERIANLELSDRDEERYGRWVTKAVIEEKDKIRMEKNTAKIRAKFSGGKK